MASIPHSEQFAVVTFDVIANAPIAPKNTIGLADNGDRYISTGTGWIKTHANGAEQVIDIGLSGAWSSQVFTASGTIGSVSVPANAIDVIIHFSDTGASILKKLGVVIGPYTVAEADVAITSMFAGNVGTAHQVKINDLLSLSFKADINTTLVAWKSTEADTGTNDVIISWKVAS